MRVTLLQLGLSEQPVREVLEALKGEELGDLLALPEHWFSATRSGRSIEEYEEALLDLHERLKVDVLGGLNTVLEGGELRSVGLAAIGGRSVRMCEKVHPSKATGERELVKGGSLLEPVKYGSWVIGCVACVDIFYPEISRKLAVMGASVIYNPASITLDRLASWHSALRARAIENVAFVIGVNSWGNKYPDGRLTGGASAAYSPYGKLKGMLGPGRASLTVTLKEEELEEAMRRWAFREDLERYYAHLYTSKKGL
ncbi:MAG: carbon-nitrogen hydrolase family protein [Acidilobaceae archaeon]|nr:carbon-nitrogen hydrolase family protein [Acidilobaceae archaeon]